MLLPGVFDVAFTADAVVHSRYDGRHHWTASVALAQLSPAVTSRDLESSVTSTIQAMTGHLFGGHQISASRRSSWDQAVDGHPGVMYTYRAGYRVKDLPSRYDDVSVLLVRLDDGSMVAALSSVPDDASAEVRRLARASLASLTIS
jgi:hypothetical protein